LTSDIHEGTKKRILEAGIALLAKKPFSKIAMNDVAEESGITKPMVYYYFKSKKGLYTALAKTVFKTIKTEFEKVISPEESLRQTFIRIAHFRIEAIKNQTDLVKAHLSIVMDPNIRELITNLQDEINDLKQIARPQYEKAVKSGEIKKHTNLDLISMMLHSTLNAYSVMMVNGCMKLEEVPDPEEITDVIFRGISRKE
jgi:AcrR family transcriptional regulator